MMCQKISDTVLSMGFTNCGYTLQTSLTPLLAKLNLALRSVFMDMIILLVYGTLKDMGTYQMVRTYGVCIMQVFGASSQATTLALIVKNGSLSYYGGPVLAPNIYDRWFLLNVIHDVDASDVKVYIDGVLKYEAAGHGEKTHYFKCGVYAERNDSYDMESRWKEIKFFKKC
ncbi:hypothetical protein SO802_026211 [Lithocarpus litseifolius]|uniref:Alginate lyase 2 domain-containing protein n=1 Tax=Lithocarpus litseifolius TaxID=425828 RepID=A0AAW2C0Q3_9ROSI